MTKRKTKRNVAAALSDLVKPVFPALTNFRLVRANYEHWAHHLPPKLRAALADYPRHVTALQHLVLGADEALIVLAGVHGICPDCRGGMGGCEACCFTGCFDGYGLMKEPLNKADLCQRWAQRVLGVSWWGLEESFQRSNPKDFPKLPKGKAP